MDDDGGWGAILAESWGPLVRAAVCDRVDETLRASRGMLVVAVTSPDDAPADAVERVHDAIVAAIAVETGANLDELGSQSAWATYDDVWAELGRRWSARPGLEPVLAAVEQDVLVLLRTLPREAVEQAGAVVDGSGRVRLVRVAGRAHLDVEGVFRWLATEDDAATDVRERARQLVALARRRP